MVIEAIVLIICLVLFLFALYVLTREDFVFMRKNITLDNIFDVAFLTVIAAVLFARLFYVLFHFNVTYLNPLVFFLVPYFPGLSLLGGVVGGIVALLIITKQRKYPRGRFIDFFTFGLLAVLPFGYIGYLFTGIRDAWLFALLPVFYYCFLFIFFLKILLPRFAKGQIKDGMMGLLILMNYSLFSAAVMTIQLLSVRASVVRPELGVYTILFLVSVFFYIRQGAQLSLKNTR